MKLVWVHEDCLHRHSPALRVHPDSPSIFVFDQAEIASANWSLKRIGFIYECLLDLPTVIRCGDPVVEVPRFARETGCDGVVTVASPESRIQRQAQTLGAEILAEEPFVELTGRVDLTRFSRYWRKAERVLRSGYRDR